MIQTSSANNAPICEPRHPRIARMTAVAAAFLLACIAAFAMAGCSGSASSDSGPGFEPSDITIDKEGFYMGADGTASYAFVAINPNEGHAASNVVFSIEGYDDKGQMIAGGGATIPMMYPGVETPADGYLELLPSANAKGESSSAPKLAQLTIKPVMDTVSWFDTDITAEQMDQLIDIQSPKYSDAANGDLKAAAKIVYSPEMGEELGITNDSIEVRTVVILMDEDGRPICGGEVETMTIDANGEPVGYSTQVENAPKYDTCHIFSTPITQFDQKKAS